MSQQAYWDRHADSASFTLELNYERLTELVPTSSRILDLGCGYGRVLRRLRSLGFSQVGGLDPSGRMIDRTSDTITLDEIEKIAI